MKSNSVQTGPGGTQEKTGGASPLRQIFSSPDLRRVLPGLGLSSFMLNLLAIALPLGILQIMDRVVASRSLDTLTFLVLGIVVAITLEEVLRSVNALVTSWLGARFEHKASVDALRRMMHVPLRVYQREEPTAYTDKILGSADVAEFYSGSALLVLFDIPFVFIFLVLIYMIGGWLVIVPTVLLLFFSYLIVHFGRWMRNNVHDRHVLDDRRFNFLADVLANIHSLKVLTLEAQMERRYERLQAANAEMGKKLAQGSILASGMGMLLSQIMIISVVFAGAWVLIQGHMTPGGLAACMMLSVRALQPLRRSLSVWMRYQSFAVANQRLNELMAMPCESDAGKPELPPVIDGIELQGVTLVREGEKPVLSELSFRLNVGETVAIVGDSGSGKSSLLSLMNGTIYPDAGSILVDGRPIGEYAADSIHRQIAYLPQTPTIVGGTILENMTMFDETLNERALEIARELGLDHHVATMKLGYETVLGEGASTKLPRGVCQIITIIRALSCDPGIILFDEANLGLDFLAEKLLRNYLEARKGKCTMVLVTHRPSLVRLADRIYALENGKLLEGLPRAHAEAAAAPDVTVIAERPTRHEDIGSLVRRQFEEESDFSVCLPVLLSALGWKGQGRELAESAPHLSRQLDLSGFCSTMSNLEYEPKHVHGTPAHIDHRLAPYLFVPAQDYAKVVLEYLPGGRMRVFDAGTQAEHEIDGIAEPGQIFIFRAPDKAAKKVQVESSWFGNLFWRFRFQIVLAFLLTVMSTVLSLATPVYIMMTYDRVVTAGDIRMGAYLVIGVLIAIAIDWVVRDLKSRLLAHIGGRSEYILGSSVFQRVINLPTLSTEGASISHQVGRIKNLEGLRQFFVGPLAMLAFEAPASLVMLAALAVINPWSILVVLGVVVLFVLLGVLTRRASATAVSKAAQFSSLRRDFLDEGLTFMRAIRTAGAGERWVERFREISGKTVMANFREHRLQGRISNVAQALGMMAGLLALSLSAYLAIRGDLTGGAMIATMMIVWRLVGPMQNFFLAATSAVHIRSQMQQIENLMRLPVERDVGARQTIRPDMRGALSMTRVSFRYANDADPALLGVEFVVQPGQVVAITGPNGSGKSTMLKLISRLYVPQAGAIRLDNVDIRQISALDLRNEISYMPQDCEIFYGTIAQNLRMGYPEASDEELQWAVEMAGLTDEIAAMPRGLDTRILNTRSEQLPHGFLQRLSLARTMLKPAPVVLLDEPAGGMDQIGERALVRSLSWLRGRSTVLMVTHRPAHMRLADFVICTKQGEVNALGKFDDVKDIAMAGQ